METAEEHFTQLVRENGMGDVVSVELLGRIFLEQGKAQQALELARHSLEQKPGASPLKILRLEGEALMALENYQEEKEVFQFLAEKAKVDSIYRRQIDCCWNSGLYHQPQLPGEGA